MGRGEFTTFLNGAAKSPLVARAQAHAAHRRAISTGLSDGIAATRPGVARFRESYDEDRGEQGRHVNRV